MKIANLKKSMLFGMFILLSVSILPMIEPATAVPIGGGGLSTLVVNNQSEEYWDTLKNVNYMGAMIVPSGGCVDGYSFGIMHYQHTGLISIGKTIEKQKLTAFTVDVSGSGFTNYGMYLVKDGVYNPNEVDSTVEMGSTKITAASTNILNPDSVEFTLTGNIDISDATSGSMTVTMTVSGAAYISKVISFQTPFGKVVIGNVYYWEYYSYTHTVQCSATTVIGGR